MEKNTSEKNTYCDSHEVEIELNRAIIGWQGIDDVANSTWGSIHSCILNGDLVFAYKTGKRSDELKQVIVVRNTPLDYVVSYITSEYSATISHVSDKYIKNDFTS